MSDRSSVTTAVDRVSVLEWQRARVRADRRRSRTDRSTVATDERELRREVAAVYRIVANTPDEGAGLQFPTGRELASRLGYPPAEIGRLPAAALDSFTGVGYHLDLADLDVGDVVLEFGCGSGTDALVAAVRVGDSGRVIGVDPVPEQLANARRCREDVGAANVSLWRATAEAIPLEDGTVDVVLSNGALSLSPRPERALAEAGRVLRPGGRLAVSELVGERRLPERIRTDPALWAAGIGGAIRSDDYAGLLETAGFDDVTVRENPWYEFVSDRARGVCQQYGVGSVSVRARRRR
ncbi:methyltransferase type 11 [Natronococcus amylolyticus DSM 10524]|uniref:Methyltransferase type 11 n=1 Tax=Natronococcus amylolyticus DSM 10524 TaxID=1227497 RepID=L9WY41_9EURY|nr:methyltransferase domain-containing protein [Natronococcus amylolyticus]ELY54086.1 methyltransferase type 11 [Natronococcus amylolyticus DSM 10524]